MLFRPSIKLTLTLVILAIVFARLGAWQLERKAEKEDLFNRFENAPTLSAAQAIEQQQRFARVEADGRYDAERHILLDNRIWRGRSGVEVLTPFTLTDGRLVLVNRGWLPLPPDRASLPAVPTTDEYLQISGRLNELPGQGPRLGQDDVLTTDRWPQLITYFDLASVQVALGLELEPWIIQLDAADPSGFEGRQWKAAVMEPKVHGAYAFQWFSLMIAAIIIWIVLGVRRAQLLRRESGRPAGSPSGDKSR